jgi:DNA repair protein RecN (Recombination protein N)
MIKKLSITNYAIIEEVEVKFSKNLTIITGETGAGKSIILGAIGLIMGDRADMKSLNDPHKKCVIEAYFDILHYNLQGFFDEHDIDYDTEVVLRREITPSGKSRAFINDTPVRLPILKDLAVQMIDLHRQFDTLDLHSEAFQLKMLDALAGNKELLADYQTQFQDFQKNKRLLNKLVQSSERDEKEMDFLTFQLEEISVAEFKAGEQEILEEELGQLTNAESIQQILSGSYMQMIESETAIIDQLTTIANQVGSLTQFHKGLSKLHTKFEGLVYELEDIAKEYNDIAESVEFDQERIVEINERLDLIYRLQTKHKVATVEELLEIQAELEEKVKGFGDLSDQIAELEEIIDRQEAELREKAGALSEKRHAITGGFENQIHELLSQLSMIHARLKIEVETLEELNPTGLNVVNFMFSANKGGRLDLIKNVASGGELARLTLCTKSLVADAIPLPTLIFDEIDTGVSGDVAKRMAVILRKLAKIHQVISITHTPQIAAKADRHFFVYKEVIGETTSASVRELSRQERVEELAIMLSGNPPSEYAISNAIDLLDEA